MSCSDGSCFSPKIDSRQAARSEEELRYARLWVEIVLPKVLGRVVRVTSKEESTKKGVKTDE